MIFAMILLGTMTPFPDPLSGVTDPHLRTDRAVDTRSAGTIVRDLIQPDMTNEQKALTLFHWLEQERRHIPPNSASPKTQGRSISSSISVAASSRASRLPRSHGVCHT